MKSGFLVLVLAVTVVFGVYAFLTADLHSIAISGTLSAESGGRGSQSGASSGGAAGMARVLESVNMLELERQKAGEFSLLSLSGEKVRLRDFRGRTVLLSFWATW
ncbi:MAG: hypothetical protein Kow0025_02400 [Thermodesulfovibrionales bacterium]